MLFWLLRKYVKVWKRSLFKVYNRGDTCSGFWFRKLVPETCTK